MNTVFEYKNKSFQITRYPSTTNRSLQAWNAADEHVLKHLENWDLDEKTLSIWNDRFGFLTCILSDFSPITVINFYSQKKAIAQNLDANQLNINNLELVDPLHIFSKKIDLAILKVPKSMNLFRLQLLQVAKNLNPDGTVLCSFMTKYFTPQILEIADVFFEKIEQSKAWKKSRVILLQKRKTVKDFPIIHSIPFRGEIFKQYFGVFSAKNIDYASQFLVEHLEVGKDNNSILDLASGNGVLAKIIQLQNPDAEIHLIDDSYLAIQSSILNLEPKHTHFHFNDSLEIFEEAFFDLVVSNPPFHFGHETNIEVAIRLFKEVKRCLKKEGRFLVVSNRHLNYKTHLIQFFEKVETIAENEKFIIYSSILG